MKILKTIAIVSMAGIIGSIAINAEDIKENRSMCHGKEEMMKGHKVKHQGMQKIMQQLDLTDNQKVTLKADRKAMRKMRKSMRISMKGSKNISNFITVDGVDRARLIEEAINRTTIRVNMRADKIEKILEVLTDEQKVKFVELLKKKNK